MGGLQNFVLFVILLGVLITVHELGHFLVAKWLNVKVLRFSIGFGPKIVGFTRGETEYRIAWLPLGGYVKMAGELPYDELNPEDASRGFLAQPPWKRALIVVAGPVFNLVFPILIYFFTFLGQHEFAATRIADVQPGLPAAVAGIKPGDKIVSVEGEQVLTFNQLQDALAERGGVETRVTVERDGKTFDATLTPAHSFETGDLESTTRGRVGISVSSPPPLIGVEPGSPAANAGLKTFDKIVAVNGQPVKDLATLAEVLAKAEGALKLTVLRLEAQGLPGLFISNPRLIDVQMEKQPGEGLAAIGADRSDLYLSKVYDGSPAEKAGLREGDRLVAVNGKQLTSFGSFQAAIGHAKDQDGKPVPFELEWRSGGEMRKGMLKVGEFDVIDVMGQKLPTTAVGVGASYIAGMHVTQAAEKVKVTFGPMKALALGTERLWEDIRKIGLVLAKLVTGDLSTDTLGGPIMMYQLAGKASELGMEYFLGLMAIISVNLGIMNLLPIPILDGFALLSAIWEGIRRRPIPMRAREIANMVGLAMLVILMVLVFKNDLTR